MFVVGFVAYVDHGVFHPVPVPYFYKFVLGVDRNLPD